MEVVIAIFAGLAAIAWLVCAVSFGLAARHRKPGITLLNLAFNGLKFYDPDNFTDAGKGHQRRGFMAMLAFFAAGFIIFGLVIAFQI